MNRRDFTKLSTLAAAAAPLRQAWSQEKPAQGNATRLFFRAEIGGWQAGWNADT